MPVWSVAGFIRYALPGLDWPSLPFDAKRLAIDSLIRQAAHNLPSMPSGRSILSELRRAGYGMRTETFIGIATPKIREEGLLATQRRLDVTDLPSRPLMPIYDGFLSRDYLYQVSIRVFDYRKNQWARKTFGYSSNDLLSPSEAIGNYYAEHEDKFDAEEIDWESATFEGVYRSY